MCNATELLFPGNCPGLAGSSLQTQPSESAEVDGLRNLGCLRYWFSPITVLTESQVAQSKTGHRHRAGLGIVSAHVV